MATTNYFVQFADLAGINPPSGIDITSQVVDISIKRGRDDVLEQIQPGQLTLTLKNDDGLFSPTGIPSGWQLGRVGYGGLGVESALASFASPYYPYWRLGRRVKVYTSAANLFTGNIVSITPQAAKTGPQFCVVQAVDMSDWLRNQYQTVAMPYLGIHDQSAEIMYQVLASYSPTLALGDFDVDTTRVSPVVVGTYTNQAIPEILNDLAAHDNGVIYVSADGVLRYRDGASRLNRSESTTSQGTIDSTMVDIHAGMVAADLYNAVTVTYNAGANSVTVTDTDSIAEFGRRQYSVDLQWLTSLAAATTMAQKILRARSQPHLRPRVRLANNSSAVLTQMIEREIGDRVTIIEPVHTGVDGDYYIEGIEHEISDGGTVHRTTWQLSPAEKYTYWSLGVTNFSGLTQETYLYG